MEELKGKGFSSTYCLTLVQKTNFYSGKKKNGIYAFFRGKDHVHGKIVKPTGQKDEEIMIEGSYIIDWKGLGDMRYYCVEI